MLSFYTEFFPRLRVFFVAQEKKIFENCIFFHRDGEKRIVLPYSGKEKLKKQKKIEKMNIIKKWDKMVEKVKLCCMQARAKCFDTNFEKKF